MKYKNYKEVTFKIVHKYLNDPSIVNYYVLLTILKKWSKSYPQLDDYGYTGNVKPHLEYCSDRMNSGRAKSLLRLLEEE